MSQKSTNTIITCFLLAEGRCDVLAVKIKINTPVYDTGHVSTGSNFKRRDGISIWGSKRKQASVSCE
jgi:hypothetical protein